MYMIESNSSCVWIQVVDSVVYTIKCENLSFSRGGSQIHYINLYFACSERKIEVEYMFKDA